MKRLFSRTIAWVLTVALLLSSASITVFAVDADLGWSCTGFDSNNQEKDVEANKLTAGGSDYLKITVTNTKQTPLALLKFYVYCDTNVFDIMAEQWENVSIPGIGSMNIHARGGIKLSGTYSNGAKTVGKISENITGSYDGVAGKDGYAILWNNASGQNVSENEVMDIYLVAKAGAFNGDYSIELDCTESKNGNRDELGLDFGEEAVTFTVTGGTDINTIVTGGELTDAVYGYGDTATALTAHGVVDGYTATYQWYSNTTSSNENGTLIGGATSQTYTPELTTFGDAYYYCVTTVTHTASGCTGTIATNAAKITYNKADQAALVITGPSTMAYGDVANFAVTGGTGTGDITLTADSANLAIGAGTDGVYPVTANASSGTVTVTATKAADDNYNAATATYTVTLSPATMTVSGNNTMTVYNNGQPFALPEWTVATKGGQQAVVVYTENSDLITIDSENRKVTGNSEQKTGTAVITATITAPNHNTLTKDITVTVSNKADVSVTFDKTGTDNVLYTTEGYPVSTFVSEATCTAGAGTITYKLNGEPISDLNYIVTNAGNYTVTATYEDDTQIGTASKTFTIKKAQVAIPQLNDGQDFNYNGKEQSIITAYDRNLIEVTGNTGIDAGEYTATASLKDKDNYEWEGKNSSDDQEITWCIGPKSIDVVWSNTELTYNGSAQKPTATVKAGDIESGDTLTVTVTGEGTNAGTYTATAEIDNENYEVGNYVIEFTIAPAQVAVPTAVTNLVYNKTEQTGVTVPADAVYTITGNTGINAGDDYTATVSLKDKTNYIWDLETDSANDQPISWSIGKAASTTLTREVTLRYSNTTTQTLTVADIKTLLGDNNDGTTITLGNVSTTDTNSILAGDAAKTENGVTFALKSGLTANNKDETATITIPFTSNNYADSTLTLTVKVMDKVDVSDKLTFADGTSEYNGTAKTHEQAQVTDNSLTGTITYTYKQNDETVTEMKNVGTYTVIATYEDADNFGQKKATYVITAKNVAAGMIGDITAPTYTGEALTPAIVVKDGSVTLVENTDYAVAFSNNTNAGTATVTITGKGNYAGTASKNFTIAPKALTDSMVADVAAQTYTGSQITPSVTVTDGNALTANDYTVSYGANVNVATGGTVIVKGAGNYTGNVTKSFTITPKSISDVTVVDIANQTYTGSALTPAVTVKDGAKTLVKDRDYTVEYTNNTNVGAATITIKGKGNYSDATTKVVNFQIVAKSISGVSVAAIGNQPFTGSAITPEITVKDGSKTLVLGTDYTVAYDANTAVGTAKITITGKGNYSDATTKVVNFNIVAKSIAGVTFSNIANQTYSGEAVTPAFTVTDSERVDYQLVKDTDYTVTYSANTNAGTATVTITGKGNYSGTATKNFTIDPLSIATPKAADVTILDTDAKIYNGKAHQPKIEVKLGDKTLTANTEYTVEYTKNIDAGTDATITVKGKGNYTGEVVKTFTISPKAIGAENVLVDSVKVSAIPDQTYTGSAIEPIIVVSDTATGMTLVLGTDYTVGYGENKNVANGGTVTITGMRNYTGSGTVKFNIVPAAATGTIGFSVDTSFAVGGTLNAVVNGDFEVENNYSIHWMKNGQPIANATTAALDTAGFAAGDKITVVVTVTGGNYTGTITGPTIELGKKKLMGDINLQKSGDTINATINVYYGATADDYTIVWLRDEVEIPGATGDTYTVQPADRGHSISIKLVGKNDFTGEAWAAKSVEVEATAPSAPAVTVSAGDGKLTVNWTLSDNGGSAITKYVIAVAVKDGAAVGTYEVSGTTTSYVATGLENGTEYTVKVTAVNSKGTTASEEKTATPSAGAGYVPPVLPPVTGGTTGGTTTTNPDGSTTTTTEDKTTGTVTETTKNTDGSTTVVETQKDGTVTETNTTADGITGTTVTESNGRVSSVEVEIPTSVINKADEPVTLPVEIVATSNPYIAPEIQITASAPVEVEIPVVNASAGTVAIIVHEDGTEEIVRYSVAGDDGLYVPLDGSATVKVVDNSKSFGDMYGHWATDAVDFASSHELFNGVSAYEFAPSAEMTRAMLVTVLFRLNNEKGAAMPDFGDVAQGQWYSDAIGWASENGIVGGVTANDFAPNQNVTREQLATILYRYAKTMGMDTSAAGSLRGFADSSSHSDWAGEALEWAVGCGLIGGKPGNKLDASGTASRAEVATIFMRFVEFAAN